MSAIKVGDLVMIVRPTFCCGATNLLGFPYVVTRISVETLSCHFCGKIATRSMAWDGPVGAEEIGRLKHIDPNVLNEDIPAGGEITA